MNPTEPAFWSDRRVELMLGAVACLVLLLIVGMIVFVFSKAWPSFAHNGLAWFGSGGDVDRQLEDIFNSPSNPADYVYELRAWPLIWGTFVVTAGAVLIGVVFSLFAAIFIVEFAPPRLTNLLEPVVRLLAAVPSVVYGLIGILVVVPWVGEHLISLERKESVSNVIQLDGSSLGVGILILTVMIVPIMIAIVVDALRAVPRSWTEGAAALGVNRWRVTWSIVVRTARPAVIAAAVLATARALGEAIMLSMVSGSASFAPNPIDGLTFFFEPTRPLASALVENVEGLNVAPFGQTLFAFAAVLLVSSMFLSLAGFVAKQPLRKYGVQP
jgi:phosphate ABC transporter permease protein PstC